MSVSSRAIFRFNEISIKIPTTFSTELEKTILKFIWNPKRPKIASRILRREKKCSCRYHNS